MKRAFIVVGPESSGTRMLTKILMAGGCIGDDSHFQPFDKVEKIDGDPIVWRRSVPHNGRDLILADMLRKLPYHEVTVVVILRDWHCTELSQVSNKHVSEMETATKNIKDAVKTIFLQIAALGLDYAVFTYESFLLYPTLTQKFLFQRLGLNEDNCVNIRNENSKWMKA